MICDFVVFSFDELDLHINILFSNRKICIGDIFIKVFICFAPSLIENLRGRLAVGYDGDVVILLPSVRMADKIPTVSKNGTLTFPDFLLSDSL